MPGTIVRGIVDSVIRLNILTKPSILITVLFLRCTCTVHFSDALGKRHQSCSEPISIGPVVRILSFRHGLFLRMDEIFYVIRIIRETKFERRSN